MDTNKIQMTVEELKEAKLLLEKSIKVYIRAFEKETNVNITDIRYKLDVPGEFMTITLDI